MNSFYGTRLSDRLSSTPEGYLVAHNQPIARTGVQVYRGSEVGLDGDDPVQVVRDAAEVFHPASVASYEGKSITSPHPPTFLTADNASAYQRGHVQNVRRSSDRTATGDEMLLADLVITDSALIGKIRSGGLRSVSVGYSVDWQEDDDGTLRQRNIRANHVAIVPAGRAGQDISIMDASPEETFEASARRFHRRNAGEVEPAPRFAQDGVADDMRRAGRPRPWSELKRELNEVMGTPASGSDYDRAMAIRDRECLDYENAVKAQRERLLGRK